MIVRVGVLVHLLLSVELNASVRDYSRPQCNAFIEGGTFGFCAHQTIGVALSKFVNSMMIQRKILPQSRMIHWFSWHLDSLCYPQIAQSFVLFFRCVLASL